MRCRVSLILLNPVRELMQPDVERLTAELFMEE